MVPRVYRLIRLAGLTFGWTVGFTGTTGTATISFPVELVSFPEVPDCFPDESFEALKELSRSREPLRACTSK